MKFIRRFAAPHWSHTPLARLINPMQRFINQEASSGMLLLVMALFALGLANSPLATGYTALLDTKAGIVIGPLELKLSVAHWINDGLMALFFFLVGLEIKREALVGELSSLRAAALPIIAAAGGVIVPAMIYVLLNMGADSVHGWGIPMATDIAFALGCLTLLGDRAPLGLKIFLTAVAIVDDLIAVLVIALFYSSGLNIGALGVGVAALVALALVNIVGIRSLLLYAGLGVIVWLAFLQSGVHATIAGVLIALTIPARNRIDAPTFLRRARYILQQFEDSRRESPPMQAGEEVQQSAVIELEDLCEAVQSPLRKLEYRLHGWVALLIMPVFALANAGVALPTGGLPGETLPIVLGITLGLTLGKPIGLCGAAWLAVRIGIASLPRGVTWQHMFGVGVLAGIGFTMSLFIATLGFVDAQTLNIAKLAILLGSLIAGVSGLLLLLRVSVHERSARSR